MFEFVVKDTDVFVNQTINLRSLNRFNPGKAMLVTIPHVKPAALQQIRRNLAIETAYNECMVLWYCDNETNESWEIVKNSLLFTQDIKHLYRIESFVTIDTDIIICCTKYRNGESTLCSFFLYFSPHSMKNIQNRRSVFVEQERTKIENDLKKSMFLSSMYFPLKNLVRQKIDFTDFLPINGRGHQNG